MANAVHRAPSRLRAQRKLRDSVKRGFGGHQGRLDGFVENHQDSPISPSPDFVRRLAVIVNNPFRLVIFYVSLPPKGIHCQKSRKIKPSDSFDRFVSFNPITFFEFFNLVFSE